MYCTYTEVLEDALEMLFYAVVLYRENGACVCTVCVVIDYILEGKYVL